MILVVFFYSCMPDEVNDDSTNILSLDTINLDLEKYNLISNRNSSSDDYLYYSKTEKKFINVSKSNSSEDNSLISLLISITQVDEENLNSIITSFPSSFEVLTITLAKNVNLVNGIIVHYKDSENNIKIEVFRKDSNYDIYSLVEFPAKKVDNYTLDDILFVAGELFPEHDIEALGIEEMQSINSNTKYNDVGLLNFAYRYGYKNESKFPPSIDPGGGSKPCGLTHHCQNGNDVMTNCQPFAQGCQRQPDICPRESSEKAIIDNNMITEFNILDSNLPENSLYSVRDILGNSSKGKFYVDAYYAISKHFKSSIDIELLYKISSKSIEIGSFVNAFINNDESYILSDELYDSVIEIAQISANNSDSDLYKDIMRELIVTTEQFKNKNIIEIKNALN